MQTQRAVAIVVVLLGLHVAACGPNAKQKALKTTLISVNTARDGFVAWDDKHQQNIVKNATSLEDGQSKLKTYRDKRAKLEVAFAIAYKAVATAALDLKQENVTLALSAALELYQHVRDLMGNDAKGIVPDPPPKDAEKK